LCGELMSRIGKKLIDIPKNVKVELSKNRVKVSGPLGDLQMDCHPEIKIQLEGDENQIRLINEKPKVRKNKQLHGTMRALIANMVIGVSKGFEKKLQLYGTGYNVKEQGGQLVLKIGFSHLVKMKIPKGIKVDIRTENARGNDIPAVFSISGADKQAIGQFASVIRKVRPPEPYKGKGIRYVDEYVRRKVGKAFTSGTVA